MPLYFIHTLNKYHHNLEISNVNYIFQCTNIESSFFYRQHCYRERLRKVRFHFIV